MSRWGSVADAVRPSPPFVGCYARAVCHRCAMRFVVMFAAAGALASCAPAPLDIPEGCSPLGAGIDCGVPYPSDFFLVDDPTMPTGKRVAFTGAGKPLAEGGFSGDVFEVWAPDGFSPVTPMVASFGVPVNPASVPGFADNPAATLLAGAATAIIEADTGRRIPHHIDSDPRATDGTRRAVTLRPLVRLRERTRYVVALSGMKTTDGADVAPLEGFRRLRDGQTSADPALAAMAPHFDAEVFPVVEGAGIARGSLQLAWDFTTGSDQRTVSDMLHARAAALAALDATPPVLTIEAFFEGDEVELAVDDHPELTWRVVYGSSARPGSSSRTRRAPRFCAATTACRAPRAPSRCPSSPSCPPACATALPERRCCLVTASSAAAMSIEGFAARNIMNSVGGVGFAIDWQGMSDKDIGRVVATVGGEVSNSIDFAERVVQAMVNWQALSRAIKTGVFFQHEAFTRPPVGRAATRSAYRSSTCRGRSPSSASAWATSWAAP